MRRLLMTAIPILLLATGLIVWFMVEQSMAGQIDPPRDVTTIQSFMKWRPQTSELRIVDTAKGEHLMAIGTERGTLASGPSAYVFDQSGQLVDWSYDIGDDTEFDTKWQAHYANTSGRILLAADVPNWLKTAARRK